jgi:hypothetical protein
MYIDKKFYQDLLNCYDQWHQEYHRCINCSAISPCGIGGNEEVCKANGGCRCGACQVQLSLEQWWKAGNMLIEEGTE